MLVIKALLLHNDHLIYVCTLYPCQLAKNYDMNSSNKFIGGKMSVNFRWEIVTGNINGLYIIQFNSIRSNVHT